jgi:hypothetical protein
MQTTIIKIIKMNKFEKQAGASTLEMLIAFSVLILCLSAVILVSFSNQSMGIDIETNAEALIKSGQELEEARILGRTDFHSVITRLNGRDDIYNKDFHVSDLSPCLKQVVSRFDWSVERRPQYVQLATLISSPEEVFRLGGDCRIGSTQTSWRNPDTYSLHDLLPGGNKGTGIDVVSFGQRRVAFLTSYMSNPEASDFWIFDVTDPASPSIISHLDTGLGLNSIDVAGDYAYVAHHKASEQLQVINISDLENPVLVSQRTLPGVGNSYPQGRKVYYYDEKVYVGVHETAGNEFHIYDVSAPSSPRHLGSLEINHNVHDIIVRQNYAYLATSGNGREVMILNVSNPSAITVAGTFDLPGEEDATALELLGNKLYVGRDRGSSDDFFILDISNPSAISVLGSKDFDGNVCTEGGGPSSCLGPNTRIVGIKVVGDLAFLATTYQTKGFQVWHINDPSNIFNWSTYNYSEKATGLDYEVDYIYTSNESNAALRIIYDNP